MCVSVIIVISDCYVRLPFYDARASCSPTTASKG